MDSLPGDVVADVLALLPPRGLAVTRCVCKAWRATVDAGGLLRADLLPLTVGGVFTHVMHELQPPRFLRRPCKGRPKILAGDLRYVRIDEYLGIALERVMDCCNGLLLLNNCLVNPATRRWARLPPCPPLSAGRGYADGRGWYLLFDPAVSPHYRVLGLPYPLPGRELIQKEFAEGKLVEWPPSPWTVQVFSSGTQRWEDRSVVREGEAIAIPDLLQLALQQPSMLHCYAAYWHGSLYIHFVEGFLVRLSLSDDKYRVIKTPTDMDARPNGEAWEFRIGKSKSGVYCAFTCGYQLRIWLLRESGVEVEWTLAHEKNLAAILTHVWENVDQRTIGPWILQKYYCDREEDGIEEGVLEWDFGTDSNIPDNDIQDVDQRNYGVAVRIIGFDPYEEVIFLHLFHFHAIAYHWSTSKVQYMGNKLSSSHYEEREESYFVYSPCWIGDLSEEN